MNNHGILAKQLQNCQPQTVKSRLPQTSNAIHRRNLYLAISDISTPVVWITSPAGTGKSTLIGKYIETLSTATYWYNLSEEDIAVPSFLQEFSRVLTSSAEIEIISKIEPPQYCEIFGGIIRGIPKDSILVFDNYDVLAETTSFHTFFTSMLNKLPENLKVIILSRTNPPKEYTRNYLTGLMSHFEWPFLQLTLEETEEIINSANVACSDSEVVQRLYRQSQGWAAILLLLLLEGQSKGKIEVIESDLIRHYLNSELTDNASTASMDVILSSVMMGTVSVSDLSLVSQCDLEKVSETLLNGRYPIDKNNNKKISPHIVFKSHFINYFKKRYSKKKLAITIERSAEILLNKGKIFECITLLQNQNEWNLCVEILCQKAEMLIDSNRHLQFQQWTNNVPSNYLEKNPLVNYWLAESYLINNPDEALKGFSYVLPIFREKSQIFLERLTCSGILKANVLLKVKPDNAEYYITYSQGLLTVEELDKSSCQLCAALLEFLIWYIPDSKDISIYKKKVALWVFSNEDLKTKFQLGTTLFIYYCIYSGELMKAKIVSEMLQKNKSRIPIFLTNPFHIFMSILHILDNKLNLALIEIENCREIENTTWLKLYLLIKFHITYSSGDTIQSIHENESLTCDHSDEHNDSELMLNSLFQAWCCSREGRTDKSMYFLDAVRIMGRHTPNQLISVFSDVIYLKITKNKNYVYRGNISSFPFLSFIVSTILFEIDSNHRKEILCIETLKTILAKSKKLSASPWWSAKFFSNVAAVALREGIEEQYVIKMIKNMELLPLEKDSCLVNWPWRIKIFSFGCFRVEINCMTYVATNSGKPIELLKALISYGNKPVHKTVIADWLWPDVDGDKALQNLYTNLNRLRKILGNDKAVLLKDERIVINTNICWVDRFVFQQMSVSQNFNELCDALYLYKGHFLENEKKEFWMLEATEKLKDAYLRLIKVNLRYFYKKGDVVGERNCLDHVLNTIGSGDFHNLHREEKSIKEFQ